MSDKMGRNSPCPCGSGKKHKKCCLNKDESQQSSTNFKLIKNSRNQDKNHSMSNRLKKSSEKKTLLATVSGELFQLARVCYKLHDKKKVLDAFKQLNCLDYDDDQQRWVWLFEEEAKSIKLDKKYTEIPQKMHPLVIGSFFVRDLDRLILNVTSWKRAVQAIVFFQKYIPKSDAEVVSIKIVNKFFSPADFHPDLHSEYFDELDIDSTDDDLENFMQQSKIVKNSIDRPEKRLNILGKISERMAKKSLALVEELPPNFYEDGIQSLESLLKCRKIIVSKHWEGEEDYNFHDLIQEILPKMR